MTTGGRQKAYFGSKRPISGSTFSVDFWSIFRVPLTKEKPPFYILERKKRLLVDEEKSALNMGYKIDPALQN